CFSFISSSPFPYYVNFFEGYTNSMTYFKRMIQLIHHFKDNYPIIDQTAFVRTNSTIIGDVVIGEESSIWFNVVISGNIASTRIGKRVNIQVLSMIHQSKGMPVIDEDDVTVGHQVTLHSSIIRQKALIRMGSMILDGVEIG